MPTALVNADDFGLHRDIDRGTLDCIEQGRVQSVSFCPQGKNLDWRRLRELQRHGVKAGLHLTLVGEPWGTQSSDGIPFADWKALAKALWTGGRALRSALGRELRWQIDQARQNGIALDHLDSHQHVHLLPGLWPMCRTIFIQEKIPRIRVPLCPSWKATKHNPGGLVLQALSWRAGKGVEAFLRCIGLRQAGHNTAEILRDEIRGAGGRDLEIVMHPGENTPELEQRYRAWNFNWTGERDALLSPVFSEALARAGYTLPRLNESVQPASV